MNEFSNYVDEELNALIDSLIEYDKIELIKALVTIFSKASFKFYSASGFSPEDSHIMTVKEIAQLKKFIKIKSVEHKRGSSSEPLNKNVSFEIKAENKIPQAEIETMRRAFGMSKVVKDKGKEGDFVSEALVELHKTMRLISGE